MSARRPRKEKNETGTTTKNEEGKNAKLKGLYDGEKQRWLLHETETN